MEEKKNRCCRCQTLFTPAFRHPNQKCCGKKKCVLAGRAKLQKKKMDEDPDYRENQKLSNQRWKKENPDYWKKYRKRNPDATLKNRMMQQIRNQKRTQSRPPAVKVDLNELIAKMYLVNRAQPKQQISLWLLSTAVEIKPIKVILTSKFDGYGPLPDNGLHSVHIDNRKVIETKERT